MNLTVLLLAIAVVTEGLTILGLLAWRHKVERDISVLAWGQVNVSGRMAWLLAEHLWQHKHVFPLKRRL